MKGLLFVTMDPADSLSAEDFHDWYNNEHGPTRMRLPFITTGARYRLASAPLNTSTSSVNPIRAAPWMALYDISDLSTLQTPAYLRLRSPPAKSSREISTMSRIGVDRRLYQLTSEQYSNGFVIPEEGGRATALVAVSANGWEDAAWVAEIGDRIGKVGGWGARRLWRTPERTSPEDGPLEMLELHFVAPEALGSKELQDALAFDDGAQSQGRSIRVFERYYDFGPAPRHLTPNAAVWAHDGTRTIPASKSPVGIPTVESYVTTPDGVNLPYRLEGSTDPSAPLIVFINSVLVHWSIWDTFVASFFRYEKNKNYRVLRYLPRGRFPLAGSGESTPVTVDLLAEDVKTLLDALKVDKAACVMGVSLGGATALRTALLYPNRVSSFIACDTNASAPAGNEKAWGERVAVAEAEGAAIATAQGMEAIVGEELAELTVRRWAVDKSYDGGELEARLAHVKETVRTSSLTGFKEQVRALFAYDFWDEMKTAEVKGAFVVGAGDGKLPAGMEKMANEYGKGAQFHVVEDAGHLPMVEKPDEVAKILTEFLS